MPFRFLRKALPWRSPSASTAEARPVAPVETVFKPGPELSIAECRPLQPVAKSKIKTNIEPPEHPLVDEIGKDRYRQIVSYFANYPARSLMSDHNRAILFILIQKLKPRAVAEIGTLYGGTSEVLARALWECGSGGELHTADPFGANRIPPVLEAWPPELRNLTHFYAMNSMDFLLEIEHRHVPLDMVLVDGNHDYEFALFDLQMAARFLKPGGLILMDNAEQTGPLRASLDFMKANPAWREWGTALASHDPSNPFGGQRVSVPGTSLIILQSPTTVSIGPGAVSSAQQQVETCRIDGLRFDLPAQTTSGTLHYQAIFRAFDNKSEVPELKSIGHIDIEMTGAPLHIEHKLEAPLELEPAIRQTLEVELSWISRSGAQFLALDRFPTEIRLA